MHQPPKMFTLWKRIYLLPYSLPLLLPPFPVPLIFHLSNIPWQRQVEMAAGLSGTMDAATDAVRAGVAGGEPTARCWDAGNMGRLRAHHSAPTSDYFPSFSQSFGLSDGKFSL